jgi:protein TonB
MFEDSLFASGMSPEKRRSAGRTRWIALSSVVLQGLVVAAFVAIPLIWPETLPMVSVAPKVSLDAMKKPEVKVQPKLVRVAATSEALSAPSAPEVLHTGPGRILSHAFSAPSPDEGISLYNGPVSMTGGGTLGIGVFSSGNGGSSPNIVTATAKKSEPVKVSSGVSKGLLLAPIQPVYPRIAIAAHLEGTVTVTAVIDKRGRITGLQVLSGPEMLRTAAVDAIRDARYRPYMLNGEPTDVITTIAVNFRMGG